MLISERGCCWSAAVLKNISFSSHLALGLEREKQKPFLEILAAAKGEKGVQKEEEEKEFAHFAPYRENPVSQRQKLS